MKLKRFKPICFVDNSSLLIYKFGYIYFFDIISNEFIFKSKIFHDKYERFWSRFPYLYRFLRLGIRTGIKINNDIVLLEKGKTIYEYSTRNNSISDGFSNGRSRALKFSIIENIFGFEDCVVFGEYFSNPFNKETNIYKRIGIDKWEILYTFPNGLITHIHNIIPDKYNNCVWILTGDFNKSAGIWKAINNFNLVEPILIGEQQFRGCVGFSTENGLLYATDSPFESNSIRLLRKLENNEWISEKIYNINGSCIYGCEFSNNRYVFSTTVEADGRNQKIINFLFGRKRGKGIKDNMAHIYIGNITESFREIYAAKKDFLPFSFQFGSFMFPEGINQTNYLPIYQKSLKNGDLTMKLLKV